MTLSHVISLRSSAPHVLAADGVFRADGTFVPLPAIPEALLERGFRRAVLDFLVGKGAICERLRGRMPGRRYSGFSVHVCVAAFQTERRKKLAGYMLRAPRPRQAARRMVIELMPNARRRATPVR